MKVSRSRLEELISAVGRWKGRRVVVLGDMILDEFTFGRTDRVSREAPVLIVRYDGSSYSPGGGANAAQNIASMGGTAVPVGITGTDDAGKRLRDLLAGMGMRTGGLIRVGSRPTTSKTRVMAGDFHAQLQQIVRIDREQRGPLPGEVEERILEVFSKKTDSADAVILSDYGQGVFNDRIIDEAIRICRRKRLPVVADSRFRIERFRGVTTATPNEVEASRAAGVDIGRPDFLARTGRRLLRRLGSPSLLVTRGKYGMSLFRPGKRTARVDVVGSPEATDVTGAGDTVAAAVALSLAAGEDMVKAMYLANAAASVVVMKRGTAVAAPEELVGVLESLRGD